MSGLGVGRFSWSSTGDFDDLLTANRLYAESFGLAGFDGIAHAGVAMVTCMDSRLDPLAMIGLLPGDAKILRNPGGRADDQVLKALVLGTALLDVRRILIVQHTRCAMATSTERELRSRISRRSGIDASWMTLGAIIDQHQAVEEDVHRVRSHPMIGEAIAVGGFLYDVDTGRLDPIS